MQRYVSNELTHFVGRAQGSEPNPEERQYEILRLILTSGSLKPGGQVSREPGRAALRPVFEGTLSGNSAYVNSMVCFCDIPEADLSLHMAKYSKFGLAFSKEFLVNQGASPVFYIAKNARYYGPRHEDRSVKISKANGFDSSYQQYRALWEQLREKSQGNPVMTDEVEQLLRWHSLFVDFNFFTFTKFFDDTLADDDIDNFYMEREWRVQAEVKFKLDDVRRIVLPQQYVANLRADIPNYMGQISFSD